MPPSLVRILANLFCLRQSVFVMKSISFQFARNKVSLMPGRAFVQKPGTRKGCYYIKYSSIPCGCQVNYSLIQATCLPSLPHLLCVGERLRGTLQPWQWSLPRHLRAGYPGVGYHWLVRVVRLFLHCGERHYAPFVE